MYRNLVMAISRRSLAISLVIVLWAVPSSAWAQRIITSDFTQDGGVFEVSPAGYLFVRGATLTLDNHATTTGIQSINVGDADWVYDGTMNIWGGSHFVSGSGYSTIAGEWGTVSSVNVSGEGSRWTASGVISLARLDQGGVLNVTNGGAVSTPGIGAGDQFYWEWEDEFSIHVGVGTINVHGVNSHLHAIRVGLGGDEGGGFLNVMQGGLVTSENGYLYGGYLDSRATVTGTGSLWAVSDSLAVYGGKVEVQDGGMVVIGDAIGTPGTVTVGTDGTLYGRGTVVGDVINTGGIVAPGSSPGTLTIDGDYIQLDDGVLVLEIGGTAGWQFDQLIVMGDLTLGGLVQFDLLNGFVPQVGDQFDFFTVGGAIDDTQVTYEWLNAPTGFQYDATLIDGVYSITVTAVPEPSTLALAGMALVAGLFIWRKKNR